MENEDTRRYNVTGMQGNRFLIGEALRKYAPADLADYLMRKDPWLHSDVLCVIQVLTSPKRVAAKYKVPEVIALLRKFIGQVDYL